MAVFLTELDYRGSKGIKEMNLGARWKKKNLIQSSITLFCIEMTSHLVTSRSKKKKEKG